jgi:hypothetical protein
VSFKDAVKQDLHSVFLNTEEFGEIRTVKYDGVLYEDIPVVLTGLKEQDRNRLNSGLKERGGRTSMSDHVQGLYAATVVMHLAESDIGNQQPEKGQKIRVYDPDKAFYRDYRIEASVSDMGMIRLELGGIRE